MQLHLIRHTTPCIEKGICYGQTDLHLDASTFATESDAIVSKIPTDFDVYYSSPLQRCAQLAEKLFPDFKTDTRLLELDFGDWEFKKWKDIPQKELAPWMDDFVNQPVPRGESYHDLHQRSLSFAKFILQKPDHKIALITHAGNIRSFISFALNLPLENSFRIELNYGSIVQLELNEDHRLSKLISII